MKKIILSIFFLLISVGLFFVYVDKEYQETKKLKAEEVKYEDALNKSNDLLGVRDELLSKYNTFNSSDIEKLEKLLPNNIDNINLVLEIDDIASKNSMMVNDISITSSEDGEENKVGNKNKIAEMENRKYNYVDLSFSTTADYERIVNFIEDLTKSLRIIDIKEINFTSKEGGFYKVDFKIRTYWLKK